MQDLRFVWLEITGRCQLACSHCYAESGPAGSDGAMLLGDWCRVIDEVAELGGRMVQFIGGEPPILAATPDAEIIEVGEHGLRSVDWAELELVDHWRRYLAQPSAYLCHLTDS